MLWHLRGQKYSNTPFNIQTFTRSSHSRVFFTRLYLKNLCPIMQIRELPLTKRTLSYSAAAKCWFCARAHWWVKLPAWARRSSEVADRHFIVHWPHHMEAGGGLSTAYCSSADCSPTPHLRKSLFHTASATAAAPLFSRADGEVLWVEVRRRGEVSGAFRRRVCEVSPFSLLWRLTTHATADLG